MSNPPPAHPEPIGDIEELCERIAKMYFNESDHAADEDGPDWLIADLRSAVSAAREDLARAEELRLHVAEKPEVNGGTSCRLCNVLTERHEPESHAADCLARPFKGAT